MHKPESIQENGTLKILWDSELLTDPLFPAGTPDLVIIDIKKRELVV